MTYFILLTHSGREVAVVKADNIQYVTPENGRLTVYLKTGEVYRCNLVEPTDRVN